MSFTPLFSTSTPIPDPSTLSTYRSIHTTHVDLSWSIDWTARLISGTASLDLTASEDVKSAVLDASYLEVKGVRIGGKTVDWKVGKRNGAMGEGLEVVVAVKKGEVRLGWLVQLHCSLWS